MARSKKHSLKSLLKDLKILTGKKTRRSRFGGSWDHDTVEVRSSINKSENEKEIKERSKLISDVYNNDRYTPNDTIHELINGRKCRMLYILKDGNVGIINEVSYGTPCKLLVRQPKKSISDEILMDKMSLLRNILTNDYQTKAARLYLEKYNEVLKCDTDRPYF